MLVYTHQKLITCSSYHGIPGTYVTCPVNTGPTGNKKRKLVVCPELTLDAQVVLFSCLTQLVVCIICPPIGCEDYDESWFDASGGEASSCEDVKEKGWCGDPEAQALCCKTCSGESDDAVTTEGTTATEEPPSK